GERYTGEIKREIAAGLAQLVGAADKVPDLAEDLLDFPGIEAGRGIRPWRQGLGFEQGQSNLGEVFSRERISRFRPLRRVEGRGSCHGSGSPVRMVGVAP